MTQYRHGDVFLRSVAALPEGATQERRNGDVILAYGEVTGHAHRIVSPAVSMWSVGEQRYIVVAQDAVAELPVYELRQTGRIITPAAYTDEYGAVVVPAPYDEVVQVQVGSERVAGSALTHEEHDLIVIPPGTYEVLIQREYDEAEGWRRVVD